MFDGVLDFSITGYIIATLVLTHISIVSVTIYLHRYQAHRTLELHPLLSHFFRFWLWLTTGIVTKEWVAIHRKHHARCETEEDPHSPQTRGIKTVLFQGAELYRAEALNAETLERFGHETPEDWLERNVYARHSYTGIVLMLLIDVLMFGVAGVSIWAVQMVWMPFFAAGVINGIGHWWGYRNYEVADASTNIVPWGLLIGGEELHNNHHTFVSSAKFSSKWWEFDLGWCYIRLFSLFGLARVKRVPPRPVFDPAKSAVDMDTLRAIINSRFQLMAHYTRDVLGRVHRDEMSRADACYRQVLKSTRRLLVREESLIDVNAKRVLASVLDGSDALQTVYQYKLRLQAIWRRSATSNDSLLHALQEWCHQAEESGIKALQDFARALQGYSLQPIPVRR